MGRRLRAGTEPAPSRPPDGLAHPRLTRRGALGQICASLVLFAVAGCATSGSPTGVATLPTPPTVTPGATAPGVPSPGATQQATSPSPTPLPPATATPQPTAAPATPVVSTPTALPRSGNPEHLQPNGPPHDPGPLTWAHPGPYLGSAASDVASYSSRQPLVTTYYFYWFDLTNPARRERDWKLHPPDPDHYSFLNVDTHLQQFRDMQAAGIDFALPVYWSEPGHPGRSFELLPGHDFSTEGIPPMVAALDQLAAAKTPFKLGMFYDTTILANADLTTPNGKDYFYVNVRDFYSKIPPRHWAAIDDKPIVWLYDTQWVSRFDQSSLDDLSARFAQDFAGRRPYIAREWQWYQSKNVTPAQILKSDNLYAWGAAPSGFNQDPRFGVAEVGPGFDNTGYCHGGPAQNCFDVSRQNGDYYAGQWQQALQAHRSIVALETWNELDEGSAIAETLEYGRTYINLTRKYADAFHAGRRAV